MKSLTLHVGSHKTATTLAQRWLFAHRIELLARGIDYPDLTTVVPEAVAFNQWDLFAALAGDPANSRLGADGLKRALDLLEDSPAPHLLLSAENCWGLPHRRMARPADTDTYFDAKSAYVETVVDTLRERTRRDVRVVVWLRRPDRYLVSLFNQAVKHRGWSAAGDDLTDWFRAFVEEHVHLALYDRHLQAWDHAAGAEQVIVRRFPPAGTAATDPLTDFCDTVGIPTDRLELPADRANVSWPAAAVIVKHLVNREITARDEERTAQRIIQGGLVWQDRALTVTDLLGRDVMSALRHRLTEDLVQTVARLPASDDWAQPWEFDFPARPAPCAHPIAQRVADLVMEQVRGVISGEFRYGG